MKKIDLEKWHRSKHFNFYKSFDHPHFSLTANVDITELYLWVKKEKLSFFATMLYYVMKTVNQIPEFKYRIRLKEVVEHDLIHPSYTVLVEDDLFCFVTTDFHENRDVFMKNVDNDIDYAKIHSILEDVPGKDDLIYISAIPWVTFTALTHPFDTKKPDSIPRISWGKFFKQDSRILIPVSLSAHHALCDGVHVGKFFKLLEDSIIRIK